MEDVAASNWIIDLIRNGTYPAIALLMFAETLLPPIPSEVVMPVVGVLAAEERVSLAGGIASGTVGSLGGAYAWFFAARCIGAVRLKHWTKRHGRWLTVSPQDIDEVCRWFGRYGHIAVLLGRMMPAVRTLISLPAGISPMRNRTFLAASAVGTGVWASALALIGFSVGNRYEEVAGFVGLFSNVIIGMAVLLYAYRVITFRR
jgi:membrane protein DedA with SNARE-associated domain